MSMSDFIERNLDAIVDEWADFARSNIPPARELTPKDLRDHARIMLRCMAADMASPQSDDEQHEKSRGGQPGNAPELTETARQHAEQRFHQGFSLNEMLSEYRALRASVVRRWTSQLHSADLDNVLELTRLNEAMDQSVTESVAWYVDRVEESRHLMLGVLGHDLRNPLGAARSSADYLLRSDGLTAIQSKVVVRIQSSTVRMRKMVDDLLDFTRARLGAGLPLMLTQGHFGHVCRETLNELEAYHPDRTLRMECTGDLHGEWDLSRVAQMVSNLAANAIQHGDPEAPVTLSVRGEGDEVVLQVHNQGPAIAPEARARLFDPLMREVVRQAERREGSSGLGLGL